MRTASKTGGMNPVNWAASTDLVRARGRAVETLHPRVAPGGDAPGDGHATTASSCCSGDRVQSRSCRWKGVAFAFPSRDQSLTGLDDPCDHSTPSRSERRWLGPFRDTSWSSSPRESHVAVLSRLSCPCRQSYVPSQLCRALRCWNTLASFRLFVCRPRSMSESATSTVASCRPRRWTWS